MFKNKTSCLLLGVAIILQGFLCTRHNGQRVSLDLRTILYIGEIGRESGIGFNRADAAAS